MNVTAPYERLVALAEHEAALVTSGAWEDLEAVAQERAASIACLPAVPPAAARPLLERLAGLQGVITAALAAGRAEAAQELAQLRRGRGVARGYAAGVAQAVRAPGRLDSSA